MSKFLKVKNCFGKEMWIRKKAVTAIEEMGNDTTRVYIHDFCFTTDRPMKEVAEDLDEKHHAEG